jgi:hypothetical protein
MQTFLIVFAQKRSPKTGNRDTRVRRRLEVGGHNEIAESAIVHNAPPDFNTAPSTVMVA